MSYFEGAVPAAGVAATPALQVVGSGKDEVRPVEVEVLRVRVLTPGAAGVGFGLFGAYQTCSQNNGSAGRRIDRFERECRRLGSGLGSSGCS